MDEFKPCFPETLNYRNVLQCFAFQVNEGIRRVKILFVIVFSLVPYCLFGAAIDGSEKTDSVLDLACRYYREADSLYCQEIWTDAIERFQLAADYYIHCPEYIDRVVTIGMIGKCYYHLDEYKKAIDILERAYGEMNWYETTLDNIVYKWSIHNFLCAAYHNMVSADKKYLSDNYIKIRDCFMQYIDKYAPNDLIYTEELCKRFLRPFFEICKEAIDVASWSYNWLDVVRFSESGLKATLFSLSNFLSEDETKGMIQQFSDYYERAYSLFGVPVYDDILPILSRNVNIADVVDNKIAEHEAFELWYAAFYIYRKYSFSKNLLKRWSEYVEKHPEEVSQEDGLALDFACYKQLLYMGVNLNDIGLDKNDIDIYEFIYIMQNTSNALLKMCCTKEIADILMKEKKYHDAEFYLNRFLQSEEMKPYYYTIFESELIERLIRCRYNAGEDVNDDLSLFYEGCRQTDINTLMKEYIAQTKSVFAELTSKDRAKFWSLKSLWFKQLMPEVAEATQNQSIIKDCYDGILLAKNILLQCDISIKHALDNAPNNHIAQSLYKKSSYYREHINVADDEEATLYYMLSHLFERRMLVELYRDSQFTKYMNVTWSDVRDRLQPDELAIEFINFKDSNNKDTYAALTLKREYAAPHFIRLGDSRAINNITIESCLKDAYRLVWKPLQKELMGVNKIYFSADGILYTLPIEICLDNDNIDCYRLSSTRYVAMPEKTDIEFKHALLIGNIDYNECQSVENAVPRSKMFDINYIASIEAAPEYENPNGYQKTFTKLSESPKEMKSIMNCLESHNVSTRFLESDTASEENIKFSDFRNIDLLHISTHGIFIKENEITKFPYLTFLYDNYNNAMFRSMLVCAGANKTIRMQRDNESMVCDGFLLAHDIANLNLKKGSFVSLATCNSGLGELTSEGVWGLQRGFKQAGARTIMMSLADVDDEATGEFMRKFFSSLMESKKANKALKEAREYMRFNDNVQWHEPKYWAPFILIDAY